MSQCNYEVDFLMMMMMEPPALTAFIDIDNDGSATCSNKDPDECRRCFI